MSEIPTDRPKVGIGVIVMRQGRILIGERAAGHGSNTFMIPSGHLEFGESFEETACREVEEETGLKDIEIKGIVFLGNDIAYEKHYVTIGVLAGSKEGEPYNAEPDKCQNWTWMDPKDVPDNMFYSNKKVIENWLKKEFYTD